MRKQFTRKGIEKLFYELYPQGEINIEGSCWNWFYCENTDTKVKNIKASNLYDVAIELHLVDPKIVAEMKKAAGYISYK